MTTMKKAQNGATTKSQETLSQKNARIKKEIEARENRIQVRKKEKEKNSYSNARANKVVGRTMKKGGVVKKAKSGGSFPDLNKDGKITKADILKGRGVIAKKGATLKKQAAVAIAMKKAGKTPKKMQYGGKAASMAPTMKKGGAMKKCAYGCK
jgi:beta-N-acetylglucosaminidase